MIFTETFPRWTQSSTKSIKPTWLKSSSEAMSYRVPCPAKRFNVCSTSTSLSNSSTAIARLAVLAQMAAGESGQVNYWGTTSGNPLPENLRAGYRWTAQQMLPFKELMAGWQKTLRLEIDGLGPVLFCHGTPRSETEVFTRLTPEDRLMSLFEELNVSLVVCGHTHMQFDRMIGHTRVVNAGSIGEPFGNPGAYWLLLGPDVELRQTSYDHVHAAMEIRATSYPQAEESANDILLPPPEDEILEAFSRAELK